MEKPGKAEPQTAAIVKENKKITKKKRGGGGQGRRRYRKEWKFGCSFSVKFHQIFGSAKKCR